MHYLLPSDNRPAVHSAMDPHSSWQGRTSDGPLWCQTFARKCPSFLRLHAAPKKKMNIHEHWIQVSGSFFFLHSYLGEYFAGPDIPKHTFILSNANVDYHLFWWVQRNSYKIVRRIKADEWTMDTYYWRYRCVFLSNVFMESHKWYGAQLCVSFHI